MCVYVLDPYTFYDDSLQVRCNATDGVFTLSYRGFVSEPIAFNATRSEFLKLLNGPENDPRSPETFPTVATVGWDELKSPTVCGNGNQVSYNIRIRIRIRIRILYYDWPNLASIWVCRVYQFLTAFSDSFSILCVYTKSVCAALSDAGRGLFLPKRRGVFGQRLGINRAYPPQRVELHGACRLNLLNV